MRLKGRTAIVTGAGGGIGKVLAARLACEGADIVIADLVNHDAAAREVSQHGTRVLGLRTDVSSEADVARLIEQSMATFGRIDILVNNAAKTLPLTPFEKISVEDWRNTLDINALGPFLCCRAVAPHMRKARHGRIINIVSGAALKGVPNLLPYVASKGALIAMTRALARELGSDGITVNAVAPGFTLTERILNSPEKLQAMAEPSRRSRAIPRDELPEDLAGAVCFLAGDDSAFMTGQTIVVDGGSAMV